MRVSESKNIGLYKRGGFREHCSLPHCYVRKCSFLGPEFTKIAFGDRAPPGPTWGAYSAPPDMKGGEGREMGMKERGKRKGCTGSKEEKRDQGKGGELGKELNVGYVSCIVKMHYWQPYRLGLNPALVGKTHCYNKANCENQFDRRSISPTHPFSSGLETLCCGRIFLPKHVVFTQFRVRQAIGIPLFIRGSGGPAYIQLLAVCMLGAGHIFAAPMV